MPSAAAHLLNASSRLASFSKKYATPLVASLALVICFSGVLMFFHLYRQRLDNMHAWMGLAFITAIGLHLMRNWRSLVNLSRQPQAIIFFLVTLLVAALFIMFPPSKASNPFRDTTRLVMQAPISTVAPIFHIPVEIALDRISLATRMTAYADQSIEGLAHTAHVDPIILLNAVRNQSE